MTTRQYIEEVRKTTDTGSDYAVARTLGISPDAVNRYRTGQRVMDNNTALRVAEVLQIEPLEVIAAAEVERAKTPQARAKWRKWIKSPKGRALVVGLLAYLYVDCVIFNAAANTAPSAPEQPTALQTVDRVPSLPPPRTFSV